MADGDELPVVGKDGSRWVGHAVSIGGVERIEVRLADGRRVMLPADVAQRQADGTVYVPMGAADLTGDGGGRQDVVVPVVREELVVGNREEEGARVVVHVVPSERTEVVDVPVMREEVEVERRAVNQFVTEAGPVRQEGDVTIVPVYEEVIVVERRLLLKEEVRIHRRRTQQQERREVTLRSEEARVLRAGQEGDGRRDGE